jgi:hypothetical protein
MVDYRHHVARPAVVLVIGSPEPFRTIKPSKYPVQHRQPWRPAHAPPKQRRAERIVEIAREFDRRTLDAQRMLRPDAGMLRAWLAKAA